MAIQVNGTQLTLLTAAAVGVGLTDPSPLEILDNNENALVAAGHIKQPLGLIDFFILNKDTGFAIWSKGKPVDPYAASYPVSQTHFLFCR